MQPQTKVFTLPFLLGLWLIVNLLLRGPDLYHAFNLPPDRWFTGQASWFDPWDLNIYFSAINQGLNSRLLFFNQYDSEPSKPLFIYPFYTLVGYLLQFSPLSPPVIFHLYAAITSLLLIVIISRVLLHFNTPHPKLALILILFGGGLGWLFYPSSPADLTLANFTLHNALRTPHEALSLSLFLYVIVNIYLNKPYFLFLIPLSLLTLFHPYLLLPLGLISLLLRQYRQSLIVFLIGLGYYFTFYQSLLHNPSFSGLLAQSHLPLNPLSYLLGIGLLLLPLLLSLKRIPWPTRLRFLVYWFSAHSLLCLIPIPFAPLFVKSLWLPTVMLAAHSFKKFPFPWLIIIILSTFGSSLLIFYQRLTQIAPSVWVSRPAAMVQILDTLKLHPDTVTVLASTQTANLIPAWTHHHVYAGHTVQTPQFYDRLQPLNAFMQAQLATASAEQFLNANYILYLIWGSEEQTDYRRESPPYPSLFQPVIKTPNLTLYQTL